ncbi:MAG: site-2 protease family protein [Clostridia bacterium]|nr:site-2 protease family protein [Clostridia bacterium]
MTIVITILVFGLIILVHEFGHFIVAKLSGITVLQFTIGFGPAIFKKKIGETLYALRLLPIGGAVMMKGENAGEEELLTGGAEGETLPDANDTHGSFMEASKLKRFLVSVAGSAMNLLCGVVIIAIIMAPAKTVSSTKLAGFMDGAAIAQGPLQAGDEIVKIDGFRMYIYGDLLTALALGGDEYDITVLRGGERIKLENVELKTQTFEIDGKSEQKYGFIFSAQELSFGGKIKYALNNAASFLQSAVKSLQMLFTGRASAKDMMGTVGIATEISDRAKTSMREMWYFVAFLSVNIGFVNLLPIPALDGGKILFILVELIRGKKLDPKYESYISMAGMVLLLGLFAYVTFNDISRLVRR